MLLGTCFLILAMLQMQIGLYSVSLKQLRSTPLVQFCFIAWQSAPLSIPEHLHCRVFTSQENPKEPPPRLLAAWAVLNEAKIVKTAIKNAARAICDSSTLWALVILILHPYRLTGKDIVP
jgi:hypothetical protein